MKAVIFQGAQRKRILMALALIGLGGVSYGIAFYIAPSVSVLHYRVVAMQASALVLSVVVVLYLLPRLSYENILFFLVLTLPFTEAFLVEVGGSLRVTYYFTALALVIGCAKGIFRFPIRESSMLFLYAYLLYATFSLSYVLFVPDMHTFSGSLRGSVYRPYIQLGQLLLMAASFFVVLNYVSFSKLHWKKVCNWIFWSVMIAAAYGYYELICLQFNLPFLNFVNEPMGSQDLLSKLVYEAYMGNQRTILGIPIVRPRSFTGEPHFFGSYLLFAAPFACIAFHYEKSKRWRNFKAIVIGSLFPLFLAINSRTGFVALGVIAIVFLFFITNKKLKKISLVLLMYATGVALSMVFSLRAGGGGHLQKLSAFSLEVLLRGRLTAEGIPTFLGGGLKIFLEHPILGAGIGSGHFYLSSIRSSVASQEGDIVGSLGNLYAHIGAEHGLIGLFLFLGFVGSIFYKVMRIARRSIFIEYQNLATAWIASCVGMMVWRVATDGLHTYSYLWVMWAMGAGLIFLHKKEKYDS